MTITIPTHLTNDQLVAAIPDLAGDERQVAARLIAHLAELDRRQLFAPLGYSSLYTYCREALGYSEDAAHNRKVAALVARRYPVVLDMLADGRLGLTTVKLLAPVLDASNCDAVLAEAAGGSKRDVEKLVARLDPRPDVPSTVRKLPARPPVSGAAAAPAGDTDVGGVAAGDGVVVAGDGGRDAGSTAGSTAAMGGGAARETGSGSDLNRVSDDGAVPERRPEDGATAEAQAPTKRPEVKPLAPERYRVQFTIGEETEKKLRRLQTLLKREIPNGDPAVLFDRGLDLLLAATEGRKHGRTRRPRAVADPANALESAGATDHRPKLASRRVPARTRRVVSVRDEERCAFVGRDGRRCTERAFLEYHHGPIPFAHLGPPTPANISLHCRAHNAYEGRRIFGPYLPPEVREARILYDAMRFPVPERR